MSLGVMIRKHLDRLKNPSVANAYLTLLIAFSRAGYRIHLAAPDTGKNDVHFENVDCQRPYAVIVNKHDLLFYFRKTAAKPQKIGELEINQPVGHEVTVRIRSESDLDEVLEFIGIDQP